MGVRWPGEAYRYLPSLVARVPVIETVLARPGLLVRQRAARYPEGLVSRWVFVVLMIAVISV